MPNERVQEEAGQRQDRDSQETVAQFSYQRIVSARVLGDVRGMVRDLSAGLWSNSAATPIAAEQDRGFRELYFKGAISAHFGAHEWKVGGDVNVGTVRERFGYQITDPESVRSRHPAGVQLRRSTRRSRASSLRPGSDPAGALDGQCRTALGSLPARRRRERPQSPAVGGLVLARRPISSCGRRTTARFKHPRSKTFCWPALLTSIRSATNVVRLPVPSSLGNFYEVGVSKALSGTARVDASYFRRSMSNFADDDLLLNTGVSFPMAFRHADITGTEVKLDVPRWRAISGFASYAWLRGIGRSSHHRGAAPR